MTEFLDWLDTNKEWVFSGVGLIVIAAVVKLIILPFWKNRDGGTKMEQHGGTGSSNIQSSGTVNIDNRTVERESAPLKGEDNEG